MLQYLQFKLDNLGLRILFLKHHIINHFRVFVFILDYFFSKFLTTKIVSQYKSQSLFLYH